MLRILITGATGKVGQNLIRRFLATDLNGVIRAFCHKRLLKENDRLEVYQGNLSNRGDVRRSLEDVTHVLHLATCKETPDQIMDTAVKGLFWLLEECRISQSFQRFLMVGGDAAMGHFFYRHPIPVTELQGHTAYPGCYALSKVLEEVMLQQYFIQYDLDGCCLRAPWIMEKDDFRYSLTFGKDVFGGPRWREYVGEEIADEYERKGTIPVMLDRDGQPVLRNFVHVEDLVDAILTALLHPAAKQQTFNICMDEPVNYREAADYLQEKWGLPNVEVPTEYYGNWMDNSKARFLLGWRPRYDLKRLIDSAWNYKRKPDEPRLIWYPG